MKPYLRFALMVTVSTLVMSGLMYLNTYAVDHVFFSETRALMSLVMGGAMGLIMLVFMLNMYKSRGMNVAVIVICGALLVLSLWSVRSQAGVGDVAWMKGMIPHHSIAVLTGERANLSDPRVKDLSRRILQAQRAEIEEMKGLIADLEARENSK